MTEILRVSKPDDIEKTAALAHDIWTRHYVPIIGQAQTDYMLARFQSAAAITQQIAGGYEYYLVTDDGEPVGYFALVPRPAENSTLLSKIYVREDRRKTGLGRAMVKFAETRCAEMGIGELWLTVNKHNAGSIAFYRRMGFTNTGSLVQDIGSGFVMDDYRMAKRLDRSADKAHRR
jgi:GNAT superfamily N-acetyltransferase